MGLVERARDPGDERRVRLTVTAKGQALHREAQPVPAQIAAAMGRPPEDLKALRKDLRRIRNALLAARAAIPREGESSHKSA